MLTKTDAEKLKAIARNWQSHHSLSTSNPYVQMIFAIDEMTEKDPVQAQKTGCDLCSDNTGLLYIHATCHMQAPLTAVLEGDVLTLSCHDPDCKRVLAKMVVSQLM